MSQINVSVIIPTIGRESLGKLLQSLKGQPYHEIIVALEGNSPAAARNRGAIKATGELLVFVDDDVILAPDFIKKGIEAFWNGRFDYGQSRVVGGQENGPDKFIGTAMWFWNESFSEVGGFDETYPFFNEDIDIDLRMQQKGYERVFIEDSLAFHPGKGAYEKLAEGNKILKKYHPKSYKKFKKEMR